MRRARARGRAVVLMAVLLATSACTGDAEPTPDPAPSPSAEGSSGPVASVSKAWVADIDVRPDWVGRGAAWAWSYSDDVVVVGKSSLVSLDSESGQVLWRVPLGGRVCAVTPTPSKLGLVAVTVGRCRAATDPTRGGSRVASGAAAVARRTTIKAVDLESASILWERPSPGAPALATGEETLLVVDGCRTRRISMTDGLALGRIAARCTDRIVTGQGVAIVTPDDAPRRWRVVDIDSGETTTEVTAPIKVSEPQRILGADPLLVIAADAIAANDDLVRVEDDEVARIAEVPIDSEVGFARLGEETVVLTTDSPSGALRFSLEDGAESGATTDIGAQQWIPVTLVGDAVLGFEGAASDLDAGQGALTLRSLTGAETVEVGEFGAGSFNADTNLAVAGPQAVVVGDLLLMPGHGNGGVLAYRVDLPE